MKSYSASLMSSRFSGDSDLLDSLRADSQIAEKLKQLNSAQHRNSVRTQLLSGAVRVDVRLVPAISNSFEEIRKKAAIDEPMEAYLYQDSSINACVTKGRTHTIVALSSGAINGLSDTELEFVIGHELGHTMFKHLEIGAAHLVETELVDPKRCMQLRAWQRAAEISADRCGLLCCGSLDVAATALFKILSGLTAKGLEIDPAVFSEQWEALCVEVIEGGGAEDWHLSHPFPPLRMKAMKTFWDSGFCRSLMEDADAPSLATRKVVDDEVTGLLAMMDPLARESKDAADPILADFFLWGGLYMAFADGAICDNEIARLESITGKQKLRGAMRDGQLDPARCMTQFRACIEKRHRKITAMETHRIIQGLLQVAHADGIIDEAETEALKELAILLKIKADACDLLISNFLNER